MSFCCSEFLGDEAVRNVGLLEVAEVNNIVLLFPQLRDRDGSRGCWDYSGYDGDDFGTLAFRPRCFSQQMAGVSHTVVVVVKNRPQNSSPQPQDKQTYFSIGHLSIQ